MVKDFRKMHEYDENIEISYNPIQYISNNLTDLLLNVILDKKQNVIIIQL